MNDEPQYSRGVVAAGTVWLTTMLLLLVAWLTWAFGGAEPVVFAILLAESACVAACVAVVMHVRCYVARTQRLIRVTSALERPRDAEVREFAPRDR